MTREVLVVHGAGEPLRREGKVYWEPMLQRGLGSEYVVRAPRMPEPEDPNYRDWAERLAELLEQSDRPALVGHSFGASVILKYLSETTARPPLAGVFLAAVPFWGPKFPELALRADFGARLRELSPLYFYRSAEDAVVPLEHLERYRKALPHAVVRSLDGRGHEFDQPEFPELVADIAASA